MQKFYICYKGTGGSSYGGSSGGLGGSSGGGTTTGPTVEDGEILTTPVMTPQLKTFIKGLTTQQFIWWQNTNNLAAVNGCVNYLIQNNYSSGSVDVIKNLINLVINNSSFEIVPFNSGYSMNFGSIAEFNSFINQYNIITTNSSNNTNVSDNGVQISSSKIIDVTELNSVKFDIVANKSPFSLDSGQCNSYQVNFLLGNSWVQSNIALINLNSIAATIRVRGYILVGFNIGNGSNGDIGLKIRRKVTFNMNINNGEIYGTNVQHD